MLTRSPIAKASLGLVLALGFVPPTLAQIVPNGAGTVVNPQGNQINITGGTQAGGNLFHSFRDFNVNSAQVANFLSNPQIQNILGRINGGNPSVINGLLQVTGGNSNLFLMNPAGIIFGQGASLNVPASFTATTANQIGFGNNNVFNAFGDNNFSALVGNPDSFIFTTTQAGSIVNAGNLAVGTGQNISLIGGNSVNTGNLTAPGGEIQLLAVPGTNRVRLSQPGQVLSLEFVPPVSNEFRAVDLPALLTGRDLPGIAVNPSGQVQVAGTSLPNQQGIAVAAGRIDVSSATGNGGVVQVLGDRVAVLDARINANGATGGGTVRVGGEYLGGRDTGIAPALRFNSQRTLVDRNSLIRANATVTGEGGRVIVWADQNTGYFGRITGRGATGRGGFVEISGRENLAFDGRVEIPGANGLLGSLLLDPLNIVIGAATTNDAEIADGIIGAGEAPGATWFISAGALAAIPAATAIDIAATNNIDFQTDVNLIANGTTPVTFNASSTITASLGAVNLNTRGRNVTLIANSIDAANLSINTQDLGIRSGTIEVTANNGNLRLGDLRTDNTTVNSGDITLNSSLGTIITGMIRTGALSSITGNSGAITITSQGDITTNGSIISGMLGTGSNSGAITITSQGDITTNGSISSAILAITGGNSGAITITSQGNTTTGGFISSASPVNSGAITITSQGNISTGDIFSSTENGNSGTINLTSQGDISTGLIDNTTDNDNSGNIDINSQGNISTGYIDNTANNSGNISFTSLQGNISTGYINNTANNFSGNISFTSLQGNISTGYIDNTANNGSSGNIDINSQGSISTGYIGNISNNFSGDISLTSQGNTSTGLISSISNNGNGGAISLTSQGNISSGVIFSSGTSGGRTSGNINIDAANFFRVLNSFNCNGLLSSLCSAGQSGATDGAVTIRHGGSTTTPFTIGNASINGTAGAINAGAGVNRILTTTVVPVPPAVNTYGNITIITTAPEPPPPIPPELIPLFQAIPPPPAPAPVIVGLPPIETLTSPIASALVVAPIETLTSSIASAPVIPLAPIITPLPAPIITPPSVPVVLASPPSNPAPPNLSNTSLLAISPGNLDDSSRSRQTPLNATAQNVNLPLVDRIPTDSLTHSIRLLDQPFKEEFQAFAGLADEIATLDVNQAQDTLQRITRETNTKPVFIYVFFTPANEAERNVNSSRGLSSPLRIPQDTDILEVVLVPPTGDLVRVKYPNLSRPQVMETAQRFVNLTANRSNSYISSARQLHEWIIAPLQEELKKREIDNLVFLMDAGLRSIPLAALRDGKNSDRFIIEDYSVGLMPSLTLTDTSYTSLRGSEVLGMGIDTFGETPVPGIRLELNTINQLWGGNTLLNENFTLSNLRQARRPGQRIVHLATQGVFAPGDKSNSYIQLWGDERLTLDQIRQAGWGEPPVDLLVLSACQATLGDRESELGFAGLAVQAGVKSALASLWLISDEGTLGLMTEFYGQLKTTTTKSEALRQAQLAMLRGEVRLEGGNLVTPQGTFPLNEELRRGGDRQFTHPYFWSAFNLLGNPW